MLHPSTKKLIDKLSEMTRRQRVSWLQGEDGKIYHDTEGFRVILTPAPHQVQITDALGKAIETASDEDFAGVTDAHNRPYAMFIGELYRDADRCARGAERAIDVLLKGLDREEETPAPPVPEPDLIADAGPEDLADELASTEDLPPALPASPDVQDITDAVATLAAETNAEPAEPALPAPSVAPVVVGSGVPAWIPVAATALDVSAPETDLEPEPEALQSLAPEPVAEPQPSVEPTPMVAEGYEEPDFSDAVSDAERLEFDDLKAPTDPEPVATAAPESVIPPPAPAAPPRYPQFGNYGRPFAPSSSAPTPAPPAATPLASPTADAPVVPAAPAPPTPVEAAAEPATAPPPSAPNPANLQRFSLSGLGYGAVGRPPAAAAPPESPAPSPPAPEPAPVAAADPVADLRAFLVDPPAPSPPPPPAPAPPKEEAFEFTNLPPAPEPAAGTPASQPLFRPVEPLPESAGEDRTPEPAGDVHTPGRPRRFNPWQ